VAPQDGSSLEGEQNENTSKSSYINYLKSPPGLEKKIVLNEKPFKSLLRLFCSFSGISIKRVFVIATYIEVIFIYY
jgi:hypothetical protein